MLRSTTMKKLPLGIQTLKKIHEENCVYIDKTDLALKLIDQAGAFFLSRPRRFGKSLFLDTLQEIFQGNQSLFEGLYIHDKWDWTVTYPVIKIDFAGGILQNRQELDKRIIRILADNAQRLGVQKDRTNDIPSGFGELIKNAEAAYGQRVVVLVDEYDKPILDTIDHPETAAQMREGLKNFYSVLKEQDAHIQFVFMTGVSKFSKVSLFSGLNQLKDITLSQNYATICGYTHEDLQTAFAAHLAGVDWDKLKRWYDGYKWLGDVPVYNPYDILLFISENHSYRTFWFETGNPSFLIKLFQKNNYFLPNLENIVVTEEILDSFDIEMIDPLTLLFQTGYLTIDETFTRRERMMFRLKIPNMEIKIALSDAFINGYTCQAPSLKLPFQENLYTTLLKADLSGLRDHTTRLFVSIPYRNFTHNNLPETEGYYASVLYAFFASLNAEIIPEDITNHGQVDMTVKLGSHIYIIEIKVIKETEMDHNPALEQIREKEYSQKYVGTPDTQVHELGLVFSKETRNLVRFDWVTR